MLAQNLSLLVGSVLAGVIGAALVSAIDSAFRRRQERFGRTAHQH
jgi:hypothetical protein